MRRSRFKEEQITQVLAEYRAGVEMTLLFLGKADECRNKRNGYYEREYALKGVGCLRIRMPRDEALVRNPDQMRSREGPKSSLTI